MMRKNTAALVFAMMAVARGGPAFGYEMKVVNTGDRAVAASVAISLDELPENMRAGDVTVTDRDGTVWPSQMDDLDGDGRADELLFRIEVPAHGAGAVILRTKAADLLPYRAKTGAAWAEAMWHDPHLENHDLRLHLPTYWEETDRRPYRFPPDVPWPRDVRGLFEVRDRRNDRVLLDFTLKPDRARYVVEDVQQHATGGPVRNTITRMREVRDVDDPSARFRVEERFILNRHERRLDLEIAIENIGPDKQAAAALRVLDGKMGDGLTNLDGKRSNLLELTEGRAQLWHNAATGFGLAYIPHQPDRGWQSEEVGTGYFRFAGGPGGLLRLSGLREGPNLASGEETRFRFSFVFYDEKDAAVVREQFLRDVDEVPGALAVFGEDGKALCLPDWPLYLADGLQSPDRWLCEPGARVERVEGGLQLDVSRAGQGVFTPFARDFREPTELRGEVEAISPDAALQMAIEDAQTGEVYQLGTMDGKFSLDLSDKLPRGGVTKGLLYLRPVSEQDDAKPAVCLKALAMSWPAPKPPSLHWPREDQRLTNVAVVLEMHSEDGSERGYEVQVARDEAFNDVVIADRLAIARGLKREEMQTKYLPETLLDEGTYYWRVRPLDWGRQPGEWTETRRFVVDDAKPGKIHLVRPITPSRPVHFISGIRNDESRRQLLAAIQDRYPEAMTDLLVEQRVYEQGQTYLLPIFAVTSQQPTLPMIEHAFRNEPQVIGVVFAEYGFDPRYLERVLVLAAKYGRYVSALNLGLDIMQQTVLSEEFYPLMKEYGGYLLPQHKQNNRQDQFARTATQLGAYLTGRVGAWGTETEYGFAWKPMSWDRPERSHHIDYPLNWMRTYVFGLSIGAVLYRTEGFQNNKFSNSWTGDDFGPLWHRAMGPFFEDVLKYEMVPTREEILQKVRVAVAGKPEYGLTRPNSPSTLWPNRVFGALHGLPIEGVPVNHVFENTWTPDWPRFYVIPMLPAYRLPEDEALFASVIDAESFEYPEDAVEHVGRYYPPTRGDAYAVLVGDTGVVLHSIDERRDPRSGPQDFHLALTKGPIESVEGTLTYQAYLLLKQMDDALFVHANNFEMHYTDVTLRSRDGRELVLQEIAPDESVITSRRWDADAGTLHLTLNFHAGVPRFIVKARGQGDARPKAAEPRRAEAASKTAGANVSDKPRAEAAPAGEPQPALVPAEQQDARPAELVFTGYPDPTEWLTIEVMSRVAREYERAHPEAPRVRFEPGLTYQAARTLVTQRRAAGMIISEEINRMRTAVIFQEGLDGRGRGVEDLTLDKFVPVAARVIRSETELLAKVRLGFVTDRITPELEDFLAFLSSERGRAAVREIPFMEPVVRREQPMPVNTAPYKPYKSGNTVTLKEPILTY